MCVFLGHCRQFKRESVECEDKHLGNVYLDLAVLKDGVHVGDVGEDLEGVDGIEDATKCLGTVSY